MIVDDTLYYFGIYNFSVVLLDQQVIKSTDNLSVSAEI